MPGSVDSNWRRSPSPGLIISPFNLTEDHQYHTDSPDIIYLTNEDKVFCPRCLDKTVADEVSHVDESHYLIYIHSLLEALDFHGHREQLRQIVIPMLEILLKHKQIKITRDDDFHELSRIIYKTLKSREATISEFSSLSMLLSSVNLTSLKPVPLKSAWIAWGTLIEVGRQYMPESQAGGRYPETYIRYFISLFAIIRTYLRMINSNIEYISDIVFQVMIRDSQEMHSRQYYGESQVKCLDILKNVLIPKTSFYLDYDARLDEQEANLLGELFGSLEEALIAARRLKKTDFVDWLKEMDFVFKIHSIYYKSPKISCKRQIDCFLKEHVLSVLEESYGPDSGARDYVRNDAVVHTSANIVKSIDKYDDKFRTFGFYVLLNCAAIKLQSEYFNMNRVRKVLGDDRECMEHVRFVLTSSLTLMRAYALVLAASTESPIGLDPAKKFIRKYWKDSHSQAERDQLYEIFCYEETVFNWSFQHPDFSRLVDHDCFKYCLKISSQRGFLVRFLKRILNSAHRHLVSRQIRKNHLRVFNDVLKMDQNDFDDDLLNDLASLLSTMSHETILRAINGNLDSCLDVIQQELKALTLMFQKFEKFDPFFEDQFIIDLTMLIEELYQKFRRNDKIRTVLCTIHQFMSSLIRANHSCINKMIQQMNHTILGYMYSYLCHQRVLSPALIQSIAEVLIAYNSLDYPYEHRLESTLFLMIDSALSWTLSKNGDLHQLALILIKKVFTDTQQRCRLDHTQRSCLTTGFIQMLFNNHDLLTENLRHVAQILELEEFQCNPMSKQLIKRYPELGIAQNMSYIPPSPDLSFISLDDDQEPNDDLSISRILDHLSDDLPLRVRQTPRDMFVSQSLGDTDTLPTNSGNTQDWERWAHETSQKNHGEMHRHSI